MPTRRKYRRKNKRKSKKKSRVCRCRSKYCGKKRGKKIRIFRKLKTKSCSTYEDGPNALCR